MADHIQKRLRRGGLAAWSIRRPVAVSMLALSVIVMGFFSLQRLGVDLLPHLIYPEIRVRIIDPGVPARIMEDLITRQLEEQLAITENAISVQSTTTEGRSTVDLTFPYGTDIDIALRDASTRLDRAKRFLPTTIDPPVIYKRDPSQIAVLELIVSSATRDPVELRRWVDYSFGKSFLNLPGVAAAEVGGGLVREIQIEVDQFNLANLGFSLDDVITTLQKENIDAPGGRLYHSDHEISTRASGRFQSVTEIANLPLWKGEQPAIDKAVRIRDIARVIDSHEDEKLRIRLNGIPGVKLSIQKQPTTNTVEVVDNVMQRLGWLKQNQLIPDDIQIEKVGDQSLYVRYSLQNATITALTGALLAMFVVYIFLGNVKRTLIIGTAIPIAILVTFIIMDISGITLNIMTLGGLALGMGLLIDTTIVMLENITRHQSLGESDNDAAVHAAQEVNSAIVASTSTNLAAVLPFLFIGGLIGLLFSELIITISAAIISALVVALTLVPSYGSRIHYVATTGKPRLFDQFMSRLQHIYMRLIQFIIRKPYYTPSILFIALAVSIPIFNADKQIFLPKMDEGQIRANLTADAGIQLAEMDEITRKIERLFMQDADVETVFTSSGGFVFGRSEYQSSNRSRIEVQLIPKQRRDISSEQWIKKMQKKINQLNLAGVKVRMRVRGVRGVRISSGDDDLSLRVQGPDVHVLTEIGADIVARINDVPGLKNLKHSYEEIREEITLHIKREYAADLGVRVDDIGRALRVALQGLVVTDYIDGDQQFDVRLRLPRIDINNITDLKNIIVGIHHDKPIYLNEVADIVLTPAPASIQRDRQQRVVEISASLSDDTSINEATLAIHKNLEDYRMPEGYQLYDGGETQTLKEGRKLGAILLAVAIFLVFVVMAVQYESLLNPIVILLSMPFAIIGVALGLTITGLPLSMPVWLGMIMLAGIVVNNAIVLVEQIEIEKEAGLSNIDAIIQAAGHRLRPILMTTLTTVVGMTPLAIGFGNGAEMLQPLAVVIVWGLSFSMIVSLILVPSLYRILHRG